MRGKRARCWVNPRAWTVALDPDMYICCPVSDELLLCTRNAGKIRANCHRFFLSFWSIFLQSTHPQRLQWSKPMSAWWSLVLTRASPPRGWALCNSTKSSGSLIVIGSCVVSQDANPYPHALTMIQCQGRESSATRFFLQLQRRLSDNIPQRRTPRHQRSPGRPTCHHPSIQTTMHRCVPTTSHIVIPLIIFSGAVSAMILLRRCFSVPGVGWESAAQTWRVQQGMLSGSQICSMPVLFFIATFVR